MYGVASIGTSINMSKFELVSSLLWWSESRVFWEGKARDFPEDPFYHEAVRTRIKMIRSCWEDLNNRSQKTAALYRDLL